MTGDKELEGLFHSSNFGKIYDNKLRINTADKEYIINEIAYIDIKGQKEVSLNIIFFIIGVCMIGYNFFRHNPSDWLYLIGFLLVLAAMLVKKSRPYLQIVVRDPDMEFFELKKKEVKNAKTLVDKFNEYRTLYPRLYYKLSKIN